MTRRSQTNPRYRRDAQLGSTRRSASSVRTKRQAANAPAPKKKAGGRRPRPGITRPAYMQTEQWRYYSRLNWISIAVALVAALVFALPNYVADLKFLATNRLFFSIVSGFWMGGLGTSMYIQFVVLRRIRKAYESKGTPAKAGKKSEEKVPEEGGKDS